MNNAEYRRTDVESLMNHALQDFLKLVVIDKWRDKLYERITSITTKNIIKSNLKAVKENMLDNGIESYEIEFMDTTAITTIITNFRDIAPTSKKTSDLADKLRSDRNIYNGHKTSNEIDDAIYMGCLNTLYDLKMFVRSISECKNISEDNKNSYREKYNALIEETKFNIYNECIKSYKENKELEDNINKILTEKDERKRNRKYIDVLEYYHKQQLINKEFSPNCLSCVDKFYIKASDMGMVEEDLRAASIYMSNGFLEEGKNKILDHFNKLETYNLEDINKLLNIMNEYSTRNNSTSNEINELIKNMKIIGIEIICDENKKYKLKSI